MESLKNGTRTRIEFTTYLKGILTTHHELFIIGLPLVCPGSIVIPFLAATDGSGLATAEVAFVTGSQTDAIDIGTTIF